MEVRAIGRVTFTKVEDYSIVFYLNGVQCDVLNFDTVCTLDNATFEARFFNGGIACIVSKAIITCYDADGAALGSPIEVSDTSDAIIDGGNLYLSKNCKNIICQAFIGDNQICSSSIAIIRDGKGISLILTPSELVFTTNANGTIAQSATTVAITYKTDAGAEQKVSSINSIVCTNITGVTATDNVLNINPANISKTTYGSISLPVTNGSIDFVAVCGGNSIKGHLSFSVNLNYYNYTVTEGIKGNVNEKYNQLTTKITTAQTTLTDTTREINSSINGIQDTLTKHSTDIKTNKDDLGKITTRTTNVEDRANTLERDVSSLSSTVSSNTTKITTAQNTANEAKTNAATAQKTADEAKKSAKGANDNFSTFKATYDNNLSSLMQTDTQIKSEVSGHTVSINDIKAELINIRFSANKLWFSDADTNMIEGFNNKWSCIYYYKPSSCPDTGAFTKDNFAKYVGTFFKEELITDKTVVLGGNIAEQYVGYAVTYAKFSADTQVTVQIRADDRGGIYVNNVEKAFINYPSDTTVALSFKKGWNKVEIVINEGAVVDHVTLGTKLSSFTNCLGIDCSQVGTIPARYMGSSNNIDNIDKFSTYTWYDADYTTLESKIEQTKKDITLSVSNTYETKSDATNKANNAKNDAIAAAKKETAAQIQVASNSITNTVNEKYTALDGKITEANTKIQQTANGIVSTVTKSDQWKALNGKVDTTQWTTTACADLNTLMAQGKYYITSGALANAPGGITVYALCTVDNTNGTAITQTVWKDTDNAKTYTRTRYNGKWTAWRLLSNDGNVISTINQSAEGITIDASKININGLVTFNSGNNAINNAITDAKSAGTFAMTTINNYKTSNDKALGDVRTTANNALASTVKDVHAEYATNNSSTTAPTSGWSTKSPTWVNGQYVWQRIAKTLGNGSVQYSSATCITGAQGKTGNGFEALFLLNSMPIEILNFDYIASSTDSMTLEANFYNNGVNFNASKVTLTCYDGSGAILGSPIESTNTSNIVVDGGNLYLSKSCKYISCELYQGATKVLTKSLTVTRDVDTVINNVNTLSTDLSNYKSKNDKAVQDVKNTANDVNNWLNNNKGSLLTTNSDLINQWTRNASKAGQQTFIAGGWINTHTITATQIATNTILADNIAAGAINTDKLGAEAVTTSKLKAGAVTTEKLNAGHINGNVIQANTLSADRIKSNSITASQITTANIVGTNGWINLASGTFNYGNGKLVWNGNALSINGNGTFSGTVYASGGSFTGNVTAKGGTIGGYHITESSLYSGTKSSYTSTVSGVFLSNDGSLNIGDNNGFIKYSSKDGVQIQAKSIKIGDYTAATMQNINETQRNIDETNEDLQTVNNAASEAKDSADKAKASADEAKANANSIKIGLGNTGIDIDNKKITLTGTTVFKSSSGTTTAMFTSDGYFNAGLIKAGSITTDKMTANTINGDRIQAGTLNANKITSNSITSTQLNSNSVVAGKIAANAVTANTISSNAVTAAKIQAGAVTADKIQAGAITTNKIASGAITTDKLSISDFTNYCQLSKNNLLGSSYSVTERFKGSNVYAGYVYTALKKTIELSSLFQCKQEDKFRITCKLKCNIKAQTASSTNISNIGITLGIITYKADGVTVSHEYIPSDYTAVSNTTTLLDISSAISLTNSSDCYFKVVLRINGEKGFSGWVTLIDPTVKRMANGELIVDGSITANKIAANAVTADKIDATSLNAKAATILQALIGASVFKDMFMFSISGTTQTYTEVTDELGDTSLMVVSKESQEYNKFNKNFPEGYPIDADGYLTDSASNLGIKIGDSCFVPNYIVNLQTGRILANNIEARGELHGGYIRHDIGELKTLPIDKSGNHWYELIDNCDTLFWDYSQGFTGQFYIKLPLAYKSLGRSIDFYFCGGKSSAGMAIVPQEISYLDFTKKGSYAENSSLNIVISNDVGINASESQRDPSNKLNHVKVISNGTEWCLVEAE